MSTNAHRKCAKCGATAAEDRSVQFHRFPLPGTTNILRATAWATYCWPEKDWSSLESLTANYKKGKVLCGRHFQDSCYTDSSKKRLSKFAVPGTTEYITKTIECLRSKIFTNAITLNSSSRDTPVAGSAHSDTSVGRSQPDNCKLESPTLIDDTSQDTDAGCFTPPDTPVGETPTQQVQLKLMDDSSQDTPVAGCSIPTDTPVDGTPTQQVQLKFMVDTSQEIAVGGRSAHPVIVVDTTPTQQHAAQITVMVNTPQESPVAGCSPPASPQPTLMDTVEPQPAKEPKKTRKGILQAIKNTN